MLPNYAIMVALACVGGACSTEDKCPEPPQNTPDSICPPTMHIEIDGNAHEMSLCNNATFDWLVHTLLAQVAVEKEQVEEKAALIRHFKNQHIDNEKEINLLNEEKQDLSEENDHLKRQNNGLLRELDDLRKEKGKGLLKPMDCGDIQRFGFRYSGIYTVYPHKTEQGLQVFCDLNTDGGGWLLIQRRKDGVEDFARTWEEYKQGFGKISSEFWIGNDKIFTLTQQRQYELRIEMTDYEGTSGYAFYKKFSIGDEKGGYRLRIGGYSGDAGNSMGHHHRMKFSTLDMDNDHDSGQCSHLFGNSAWWYYRCYDSNLNGLYGKERGQKGVVWYHWNDDYTPQKEVEMKIRPARF